jgi:hypothetical protein
MAKGEGLPHQPQINGEKNTVHILKQGCKTSGEITVGMLKVSSGKGAKPKKG